MSSAEKRLSGTACLGDVEDVLSILRDNPGLNINWCNENQWTALHRASHNGHVEVVKVLLTHPHININCKDKYGSTPLSYGCMNDRDSVVRVLLKDPRVDITMVDDDGCTPLWHAACEGHNNIIEWLIASGRDLGDIKNTKGEYLEAGSYTALEIAKRNWKSEVVSLIERFLTNPSQTRHEIHVKLGLLDELSASVFALIVFVCDGLLQLKPVSITSLPAARFFTIVTKLPMELQMILCNTVVGSTKQNILRKNSESAFINLVKTLHLSLQK
jgi:hypothetical protein